MSSSLRTVLHGFAALQFWFACFYDWNYVIIPVNIHRMGDSFGKSGKLKFLTYWDALLQSIFFTICTLNDVIGSNDNAVKDKPFIRKLKDKLHACLAFPLAMFVSITFWAIYAIDRELVFPKAIDPYFPGWLNHVMHTNIMIFMIIETYISFREYPTRKFGIGVLSTFLIIYLVWVHVIHAYTGLWVYPILEVLNFPLRLIFFIATLGLAIFLYFVGEKLNEKIWSEKFREKESAKSR